MKYFSEQLEADYHTHYEIAGKAQPGYTFAVKWAEDMEKEMEATGKTVAEVAESSFDKVIVGDELSNALINVAVKVLTLCWLHKEAFIDWFNNELKKEEEAQASQPTNTDDVVELLKQLFGPNVVIMDPYGLYGDEDLPPDSQP